MVSSNNTFTCSSAMYPCPPATWGREGRMVSSNISSNPSNQPGQRAATAPPATVLHNMSSTRVARGNAAKLVYKTVGGKVETTLYCSTAVSTPAAAASGSQKKGRNCPDNERRKSRREAWLQRRTVPRPDLESTAATAASALEESLSSEASPAAVAAQEIGQA